jgi:alpha-N-arabinofuranosidase
MSTGKITICADETIGTISPHLYSHFIEHLGACVEEGLWVGEDSAIPNINGIRRDAVEALRKIRPSVLRWPGGCYADDYHWEDGIGPRNARPRRVNIWWGETVERNSFGTHEFIELCRLIGAEPYLAGNVGSGSPRELRDWVEYCNYAGSTTWTDRRAANGSPEPFAVRFWGVGNEGWGCGGNFCPEDYAAEYKRFATYLRDFSGTSLFLVGCGPNSNDLDWTRRFFTKLGSYSRIHGYAAHYYTFTSGRATEYTESQWYETLWKATHMEELITAQRALMDEFDPQRNISLLVDEWGTWHPAQPELHPGHLWQQSTLRDALHAAMTLDIFHRHCDKVMMANIAQMVNVLQAMLLSLGDKMIVTPVYHIFDLYQSHQGGESLRVAFESNVIDFHVADATHQLPGLSGSASVIDNRLTLSVVNANAINPIESTIEVKGAEVDEITATVLMHDDICAHNTFERPHEVRPQAIPVLERSAVWKHTFPPASVTVFRARLR